MPTTPRHMSQWTAHPPSPISWHQISSYRSKRQEFSSPSSEANLHGAVMTGGSMSHSNPRHLQSPVARLSGHPDPSMPKGSPLVPGSAGTAKHPRHCLLASSVSFPPPFLRLFGENKVLSSRCPLQRTKTSPRLVTLKLSSLITPSDVIQYHCPSISSLYVSYSHIIASDEGELSSQCPIAPPSDWYAT